MASARSLVCEPVAKPDWLIGNFVRYRFTPPFLQGILATRRRLEQALDAPTFSAFQRAYLVAPAGDWLRNVPLPEHVEFEGEWIELTEEAGGDSSQTPAAEHVPSHSWTMGLGPRDIQLQFVELQTGQVLQTPEIPYSVLEDLFRDLAGATPEPLGTDTTVDDRLSVLNTKRERLAHCYQQALNMSDPDHPDFADSAADVVAFLWEYAELARGAMAR